MVSNSRSLVFAVTLFVGVCIIFTHCSDSGTNSDNQKTEPENLIDPEGGTVVSDDGLFELTIPEGALEEEVGITITKSSVNDNGSIIDLPVKSVYQLEPSGLQFLKPITYTLNLNNTIKQKNSLQQFYGFLAFSISESGVESISNQSQKIDPENGGIVLSGQLDHFSSVVFFEGHLRFEVNYPDTLCVGQESTMSIVITKTDAPGGMYSDGKPKVLEIGPLGNNLQTIDFDNSLFDNDQVSQKIPLSCRGSQGSQLLEFVIKTTFSLVFDLSTLAGSTDHWFFIQVNCVDCTPDKPMLISPENNSEDIELTPTLTWEEVEEADWYEIQWIREGESFTDENVNRALTKDPRWTLDKLDDETQYQWRVRAWKGPEFDEDRSIPGEWSDKWTFTTLKGTENIEFGDLTVCVEHGETKSDIFWRWAYTSSGIENDTEILVKMVVQLPDGTTAEVTGSPVQANILLLTLEIYTFGNYTYEIVEVLYQGEPYDFGGENINGEIDVTAEEQNAGECSD